MKKVLVVSASHVATQYVLNAVRFGVDSHDEQGRIGFYDGAKHGNSSEYWAILPGFGCGKSSRTPEGAVRMLLQDNGCHSIKIEEVAS